MSKEYPRYILLRSWGNIGRPSSCGFRGSRPTDFLDSLIGMKKQRRFPGSPARVAPILKRWIWEIREREADCCGEKIQYYLEKERHVHLAASKIYEILAERYVLRSKWKKNQVRGPIPV